MTTYQSVSGVRFGLQIATAALLYATARYKKVDGLTSAASRIGIAAVVQGVSQKTHAPLGERTKMSWLADGISLGLVAYGMSYTDLAKRTKWLAGAAIFGSQLAISNLKPNTALARIDKIGSKEECAEVYGELTKLFKENKETITPKQGIKTCKAFFQKAHPFSRDSGMDSTARQSITVYSGFLDELQGWEKVKAQMEYIEVINAAGIFNPLFVESPYLSAESQYFTEPLEEGEKAQFDLWMEKTGRPIQLRWSTWAMKKVGHQQAYKTITEYINGVGDKITFAQKIDLCEQFYIKSIADYVREAFEGSLPQNMLGFRGRLINTLDGVEKAKALMAFTEFLLENHFVIPETLDQEILAIGKTLDESGKATVDAWMEKTGRPIQLRRSIQSMETETHQEVYEAITQYLEGIGDKITFAQKIDLCEQFYIKSVDFYSGSHRSSPPENMSRFRLELMDALDGMEKAKAYMAFTEFLATTCTKYLPLFERIIPEIRETLDEPGKAVVDAWMDAKGAAIQEKWRG